MSKDLRDLAQLQRQRLQKIVNPLKHMFTVDVINYGRQSKRAFQIEQLNHKLTLDINKTLALGLSSVVLMFMT